MSSNKTERDGLKWLLECVAEYGPKVELYKQLGNIKTTLSPDGQSLIFNYTEKCTFEGTWNEVERISRGLIIHWPSLQVLARPFEKFFNLGEMPESQQENLPPGEIEATEKMDGSLGITYFNPVNRKVMVSTRGSFISSQSQWATEYLQSKFGDRLNNLCQDLTLLFEIIYPENRIVLDYKGYSGLCLIGARRISSGYDYPYAGLQGLAADFGFDLVKQTLCDGLEGLMPFVQSARGVEGWVVRFNNGLRVKIKTEEYIKLHRTIVGLTPARIRDALLIDAQAWEALMLSLPEEFYKQAMDIANAINTEVAKRTIEVNTIFKLIKDLPTRKDFALAAMQHPENKSYLFALLDGKTIQPMLLKTLDLNTLFSSVEIVEGED